MTTDLARLLGANIRAYRKNLFITQERLADLVGVSTPYLNLLESGKKFPVEEKLATLARVLGVRPYELFIDPMVDSARPELVSSAVTTAPSSSTLANLPEAPYRNHPGTRSLNCAHGSERI